MPVVITNPKGNVYGGAWNVVMVTFSNPVSTNYANLKAECTTESSITSGENATIEAGTLYDGTYKWYGNGSILSDHFSSYYNDRNAGNAFRGTVNWPFGAFVDVVQVKASTYKPVVFFQWQVDYNNCNQLTLRAYNSQWNERNPAVEIKTKWWSSPDSQARGGQHDITLYSRYFRWADSGHRS
ncbi:MAG: hypothetical protein HQL61_05615 [Magnetococcales bacterium]|nr:hypothetical protein [Nitrospirota bacterium]